MTKKTDLNCHFRKIEQSKLGLFVFTYSRDDKK